MEVGDMQMNNPNFKTMNLKKLRDYILSNREDDEAFYTFVDRVDTEKKWTTYPPINSTKDLDNYPEIVEKLQKDSGRKTSENFDDLSWQ